MWGFIPTEVDICTLLLMLGPAKARASCERDLPGRSNRCRRLLRLNAIRNRRLGQLPAAVFISSSPMCQLYSPATPRGFIRVGLRAAISLFSDLLNDRQTEQVKRELKWLTGEFGPARELDVFQTRRPEGSKDEDGRAPRAPSAMLPATIPGRLHCRYASARISAPAGITPVST
jgi:hypothetical protein